MNDYYMKISRVFHWQNGHCGYWIMFIHACMPTLVWLTVINPSRFIFCISVVKHPDLYGGGLSCFAHSAPLCLGVSLPVDAPDNEMEWRDQS